ncbi:hypothetical protein [Mucilaginibacter sp.]|uniref:hypothetical protein n=1 Tax=Mucilaginibacter sp. TaxID=1882438 RepID=UPI0025F8D7F1|nr:hypothetical protein [Mucilaginibacter sp.]
MVKQKIQSLVFPDGITFSKKKEEVRTQRINLLFLYIAYFKQLISNEKSGIPELNLDFAAFACLVEGSGKSSNFHRDMEAIVAAKKIIEKKHQRF